MQVKLTMRSLDNSMIVELSDYVSKGEKGSEALSRLEISGRLFLEGSGNKKGRLKPSPSPAAQAAGVYPYRPNHGARNLKPDSETNPILPRRDSRPDDVRKKHPPARQIIPG